MSVTVTLELRQAAAVRDALFRSTAQDSYEFPSQRTIKIRELNIGLVNRSRDSKGDFRVVQSDGSNSTIDLHEEQIQRTTPLLLLYMVDQNSTQGDKGIDKTFSEKVLHPVPAFGICLPNDSYGDGGTEISRPH